MNKLVALDTNIFSFVFRDNSAPGDNLYNYRRAKTLIKSLTKHGYRLIIPNLILAESFCIFEQEEISARFKKIEKLSGLIIVDFTLTTAHILAKILNERISKESKEYKNFTTKVHMKYDSMILSMAIQHNADCFYTIDKGFKKYPNKFIKVNTIDEAPSSFKSTKDGFFSNANEEE